MEEKRKRKGGARKRDNVKKGFFGMRCCDCGAAIEELDIYYDIDGQVFCTCCGEDELRLIYGRVADYDEWDYLRRREEWKRSANV